MNKSRQAITADLLVTELVTNDYRTADIFRKYNIDFCCGGKMPLSMACELKGINESELVEELTEAESVFQLAKGWSIDFIVDYVVNVHHSYFKNNMPVNGEYINRFIQSHVKKFPELQPLPRLTQELFDKLNEQVLYEIEVLFPYVRKIVYAHNNNEADGRLLLKSLRKLSASDRTKYHNSLENLTAEIAFITNDFQPQENACTTQKVMLQKLQEFIGYVGQYITIEKKILIPATLQIEINLLESCVEL